GPPAAGGGRRIQDPRALFYLPSSQAGPVRSYSSAQGWRAIRRCRSCGRHSPHPGEDEIMSYMNVHDGRQAMSGKGATAPRDGFSTNQLKKLSRALDPTCVHVRNVDSRKLSYI